MADIREGRAVWCRAVQLTIKSFWLRRAVSATPGRQRSESLLKRAGRKLIVSACYAHPNDYVQISFFSPLMRFSLSRLYANGFAQPLASLDSAWEGSGMLQPGFERWGNGKTGGPDGPPRCLLPY